MTPPVSPLLVLSSSAVHTSYTQLSLVVDTDVGGCCSSEELVRDWCWWPFQGNMGSATACQYWHWPGGIANRVEQSVLAVTGREHHYHAPPMQNGSGCAPCMLWWGSLQALNAPPPSSNTTALVLLQYLTNVKRKVRFAALKAAPEVVQFQFWMMHSAHFH